MSLNSMMNLLRRGSCEKPTHAVIPRNALFVKQETRIPQDSTPQAPTVGNKPEKQQRMGAKKGRDVISNAA